MPFKKPKSEPRVPTLEKMAMSVYLHFLEDAVAIWIRLSVSESKLLSKVKLNMIPILKNQLSDNLSGIMSSSIRQEMMDEVKNSGKFPSEKFHNQYKCLGKIHYDSESDKNVMEEMVKNGSICSSICCTGAFIGNFLRF